jgi:membrane-bound lytic murein transglycosylase D
LRLPKDKIAIFASNEDKVYAYVKYQADKRERPYERLASVKQNDSTNVAFAEREFTTRTKYHKVRKGDNLSEIADKYQVSIGDIKKWNGLRSNKAPLGRNLKIVSTERIAYKDKKESKSDSVATKLPKVISNENTSIASNEVKTEKVFKTEKVVTYKDVTKYHKVKKGDVLGEIADKYEVSVADVKKWNKIKGSNIGLGDNLKIIKNEKVVTTVKKEVKQPFASKKEEIAIVEPKISKAKKEEKVDTTSKSENYYVVAKGDNLTAIAKKNNVTVQNIKEWNNLIDTNVKVGTQLIISGESLAEVKEESISKGELKNIEHVVGKGEYLGTIARKYNTTVNDLLEFLQKNPEK